jgi:enterochelin esterase-like enzyme
VVGVTHHSYHSLLMKADIGYNIYLPPAYEMDAGKRFPVVYYLHGGNGNESAHLAEFAPLLHQAVAGKEIAPIIMVFVHGGWNEFYSDRTDGSRKMETSIITELIPHIDTTYRTVSARGGRGLFGFSMGGGGALKNAFKYPDRFCAVAAFSGGFYNHIESGQLLWESPLELASRNADKIRDRMTILIAFGTADSKRIQDTNRGMKKRLEELGIACDCLEIPGARHNPVELWQKAGNRAFRIFDGAFMANK